MTAAHARHVEVDVNSRAVASSRRRRLLVWGLIVVATVLALVSILTIWVQRQMLDNNAWRNASTDVIQNSEVQSALSAYLVNQLYDSVNVQQALEQRLPGNMKGLAAPLSTALRLMVFTCP